MTFKTLSSQRRLGSSVRSTSNTNTDSASVSLAASRGGTTQHLIPAFAGMTKMWVSARNEGELA